jgi:hypothetical protein
MFLQAGQPQLALEAFTGLLCSDLRPNVVTWTTIISGLSKHSKRGMPYAQQAYQLWKQLEASGEQTGSAAAHAAGEALFSMTLLKEALLFRVHSQHLQVSPTGIRTLTQGCSAV